MERCYGCFQPIVDTARSCPHCGFSLQNYEIYKWTLMPGTLLNGKYLVGRRLGEGGFGITYLAWDTNMETRVAIKEFYPGNMVSRDVTSDSGNSITITTGENNGNFEDGLRRYVKEAAVLAKFFELPGIVSVKDFFYENKTAYIVMEFIDGVSMKKILEQKGGKISVDETLNLIQPVISSLSIIHRNKLLHRDISPDNIMVEKNGRVKLIDFGAARYFDSDYEKSMTVMLKHGYAPIEQYSRSGEQGAYTDVYGLCAVLYRMITSSVPMDATERIREDKLIPIRNQIRKTPKYISDAIEKGLSVLPENRQQSMEELYADLYSPSKRRSAQMIDRFYRFLRNILILLIICLAFVTVAGVVYRLNKDKINDFSNKVKEVFNESDEMEGTVEKGESDINIWEEKEKDIDTDTEEKRSNDLLEEEDVPDNDVNTMTAVGPLEETMPTTAPDIIGNETDPQVEHGIIVARDGVLNGHSQTLTVGDILNAYSDSVGNWDGYVDQNSQIYIYYQGSKNGESFAIEFQIFSDDTFKVTGAARNGEQIENYSEFFQQILNEVGA